MRVFLSSTLAGAAVITWYLSQERGWSLAAAWLVGLNLCAVPLWGYDKFAAKRGWRRAPELALHTVALAGAVPASFLSMLLFRHKTQKPVFWRLYWGFLVVQVVVVGLVVEPGLRPW
jgi:uncharacterized membrane protein YsdA (DUF1294 family)